MDPIEILIVTTIGVLSATAIGIFGNIIAPLPWNLLRGYSWIGISYLTLTLLVSIHLIKGGKNE